MDCYQLPVNRDLSKDEDFTILGLSESIIKFNNQLVIHFTFPSGNQPVEATINTIDNIINVIKINELITRDFLIGSLHDLYENTKNINLFGVKGVFASKIVNIMYLIGSCKVQEAENTLIELKKYVTGFNYRVLIEDSD
jgi:hypothetical protein